MTKINTLFALLAISFSFALSQEPISKNIELLDQWNDKNITVHPSTNVRYNDVWGYTQDGIEYAMIGSTQGVHFFKINEDKLEEIDFLPGKFQQHTVVHRDIKTYQHYAYMVCDEGNSSLQIVDLQYLPDSVHLIYENDTDFVRVHNIFLDEKSQLLYASSITSIHPQLQSQTMQPMRIFSLTNPINPILLYTGPNDVNHVHDVYADGDLAILNCGYDGLRVYNMANPATPLLRQRLTAYPDMGYNHQGWVTPDGKRYFLGDESKGKRLKMFEVNGFQLAHKQTFGTNYTNQSVPHNVMCDNEFLYVAYYNEGLRIYDIHNNLREIAHYNTFLEQDEWYKMNGAWGVYSQLKDGKILVSDRQSGLFLFKFLKDPALYRGEDNCRVYPNPLLENSTLKISLPKDAKEFVAVEVYDILGNKVKDIEFNKFNNYVTLELNENSGSYVIKVEYINYRNTNEYCKSTVVVP